MTGEIDARIIDILSDGRCRASSEIYAEVYGPYKVADHASFRKRLAHLREKNVIDFKKIGRENLYVCKGGSFKTVDGIDVDPMALVGRPIDPTKNKAQCVLDLLSDGEVRTTKQMTIAIFNLEKRQYTDNYKISVVWQACTNLEKWGRVEKVQLCGRTVGWRRIA